MSGTSAYCDWIAVDWGTTHLRAWAMQGDTPRDQAESDRGMGKLAPDEFEPALLALVEPWLGAGEMPVVACGMVGAKQGWVEAPYRAVPCPPSADQNAIAPTSDPRLRVAIASGLSQASPADVMRGEETQIAGLLARNPEFDGVVCLPGTHTKWALISAGEVVSFRTFMTGEMFALLSKQSVLRHSVGEGWDQTAFTEAVADAISTPAQMAGRLFSIRAESLLADLGPAAAAARLSGILIGAELAASRPYWLGQEVAVIGEDQVADAYMTALEGQGVSPTKIAPTEATLAGLAAVRAQMIEDAT